MTDLAIDLAHDLAGVADIPEKLGALLHYDPHVEANVDIGTGVSDFRPVVGSQELDVLSQPTPSEQPTYNAPGSFASGRNTITIDRAAAQKLENTAMASLAALDSPAEWTVCLVAKTNGAPAGFESLVGITDTSSSLNNIITYVPSGLRPSLRYRDTAALVSAVSSLPAVGASEVFWVIADYDGADTITIQTSTSTRLSVSGASVVATAVFDSLRYGGSSLGGSNMEQGDLALWARKLGTADRAATIAWLDGRL